MNVLLPGLNEAYRLMSLNDSLDYAPGMILTKIKELESGEPTTDPAEELAELRAQVEEWKSRFELSHALNENHRSQVERLHADGAVIRGALESCCFVLSSSEKTFSESKVRQALSTDAGRDLLARYREAVELLRTVNEHAGFIADPDGLKWMERRDTLLATVKGGSI